MSTLLKQPLDGFEPTENEFSDYIKEQLEEAQNLIFHKLKKILDAMDFYDLITWWYETEIILAWWQYVINNEEKKARMERKVLARMKKHDGMIQAQESKLHLHLFYESSDVSSGKFIRKMARMRSQAFVSGVYMGKNLKMILFSPYYLKVIKKIRQELVYRFKKHRIETAAQV